ncbi:MAG: hypothetical protein HY824_01830 [Acidobacteria bacterium]|nr:hypothetical protein [Acidobacteriota bacterium]
MVLSHKVLKLPLRHRESRPFAAFVLLPALLALTVSPIVAGIMPPVRMKVVGADDGTPLVGVVALLWGTAHEGTITGHGGKQAILFAVEAASDQSGELRFPKQSFRSRPFFLNTNYEGPSMLLLKPGYAPLVLQNERRIVPTLAEASTWEHDGRTLRMKKATDDDVRRQAYLVGTSTNLMLGLDGDCPWKRVPRVLVTADRLFRGPGATSTLRTLFLNDALFVQIGCGSPKSFFEPYLRP